MPRPSQRDRILDAYVDLVVRAGPEVVTLEGVAAEAGVSKGGLLYHFGSREALLDGLLERAQALNDADIDAAREAPDGVPRYYLRTSADDARDDSATYRVMVAVFKLATTEPRAAEATRACMAAWQRALVDDLGDPLVAQLVAVVGEGIYLRAMVGDTSEGLGRDWDALLTALRASCPS